jgi:siroheme synthase
MSPETPAAIIQSATLEGERVLTAGLADIGLVTERADIAGPAILVIGEVVRYREKLMNLSASCEGATA